MADQEGCADPNGCGVCGIPQDVHRYRHDDVAGWHVWTSPIRQNVDRHAQQLKESALGGPAGAVDILREHGETIIGALLKEAARCREPDDGGPPFTDDADACEKAAAVVQAWLNNHHRKDPP